MNRHRLHLNLALSFWCVVSTAHAATGSQIVFDPAAPDSSQLTHVQPPDGRSGIIRLDGRSCLQTTDSGRYLYFTIDDTFAFNGDTSDASITIDYYDTGSGSLILQYDSMQLIKFPDDVYRTAGTIQLTGSDAWRRRVFSLRDARFANRQNGNADFRIEKTGDGPACIERVIARTGRLEREILGSTHAHGKYFFTDRDYLNEGAVEIANAGFRVIKLWFIDPNTFYPWNSDWPKNFDSLADMARHPYFQSILNRPFDTYVLTIFEGRDFWKGFNDQQVERLTKDFHDLAVYLLETYKHTDKVFILSHHETDWHLRRYRKPQDKNDPTLENIEGLIRWYNARQAGVTAARREVKNTRAKVYAAAEVNLIQLAMQGRPTVTNDVLPHVPIDLVSYSVYDTLIPRADDDEKARTDFRKALHYLADKAIDSDALDPDGQPFGNNNIFIGEYGAPAQQWGDKGAERHERVTRVVVEEALAFGARYICFWNVYDNECCIDVTEACGDVDHNGRTLKLATELPHCRGFWGKRVDGSYSPGWLLLREQFGPPLAPPADFNIRRSAEGRVDLSWTDAPTESTYRIERSINDGPWEFIARTGANVISHTDHDLPAGAIPHYRIRSETEEDLSTAWYYATTRPAE